MDEGTLGRANDALADRGADWATVTASGDRLLARSEEDGLLLDLPTGEVHRTFPTHPHLGPMPDATGTAFVTATDDAVEVRSLTDGHRRHSIPVTPTSRTATGRDLLAPGGRAVSLEADPAVGWARYDSETGAVTATFGRLDEDEMGSCFAVSADGSRAALAGVRGPVGEGFLAVYDAGTGEPVEHETLANAVDRIALSPDGSDAVVCDGPGGFAVEGWRSDDGDDVVVDAQFVREGREVVSLTVEGTLGRWDTESGDRLGTHETGRSSRFLSATADAGLVALSGDPARVVAPGWAP